MNKIKERREALGLSQAALAFKVSLKRNRKWKRKFTNKPSILLLINWKKLQNLSEI